MCITSGDFDRRCEMWVGELAVLCGRFLRWGGYATVYENTAFSIWVVVDCLVTEF